MIAIPFVLNTLANFLVGVLIAKFLGPAEYGRYAIAISIAIMLQTIAFEWMRLSAIRFCSKQERIDRPEIEATIALLFAAVGGFALLVALIVWLGGVTLWLTPTFIVIAIGVAIANGLFELAGALMRARFLDRGYWRFIIVKAAMSAILVVGAAWAFHSAKATLAALVLSVVGTVAFGGKDLFDRNPRLAFADLRLASRFAVYALPIVLANLLYQCAPMLNRYVVWRMSGDAEAGQFALAFDMGIRIVAAIGSTLDVLLFRWAVRAEATVGADAARRQIARNVDLVFAVVMPSVVGCWLILPSFEHLIVPETFRGPFGQYFTLLLPGFLAFALINFCIAPVFQMAYRSFPLLIGGAAALAANCVTIAVLGPRLEPWTLALAQSISLVVGLATIVAFLAAREPMRANVRNILGTLIGTAIMLLAVAPLREMTPGVLTLLLQAGAGALVYAGALTALDVCGLRGFLMGRLSGHAAPNALLDGPAPSARR